jgi:hypothetical protein
MPINCTPPRNPGQLPPATDDIMFANVSSRDVAVARYTLTAGSNVEVKTLKDITVGTVQSINLLPTDSIDADTVRVQIRFGGSTSWDYTLDLSLSGGKTVRCIATGVMSFDAGSGAYDFPFAEMIRSDADGEAID